MKVIIQRSLNSSVIVEKLIVGEINFGAVLLVCFEKNDNIDVVKNAVNKIIKIRMFNDLETNKMTKNIISVGGEFLVISQFTLSWEGEKGNRPSFDNSMEPSKAEILYDLFCEQLNETVTTKKGSFGKSMKVSIINDGPVTFSLKF